MQIAEEGKKQFAINLALFCACSVFFAALMLCVPLSSDDFEFSTQDFTGLKDIFSYVLHYGNGRVLGNLGAVLLARNSLLSVLTKALMISGVIFMLPTVLGLGNTGAYLASFLLFVSIRPAMFGQVFTWTSGFANYLPPVWMGLVLLLLVRRYASLKSGLLKALSCVLIFALALAGQLYVEHAAIVCLAMSAAALIYTFVKKENAAPHLCWLLGALAGLALMYLVPRIFALPGNRTEGYRGLINGNALILLEGMIRGFGSAASAFPPLGSVIISLFTIITLHLTRDKRSGKSGVLLFCLSALCLFFSFINEFVLSNLWVGRMVVIKNFITAVFALLPHLLWALALLRFEDKLLKGRLWALLGLSLLSLAPFLLVYPAPARVAFLAYVFAVAAILLFSDYLLKKLPVGAGKHGLRALCCACLAAVMLLGMTFVNIFWLSSIREAHIAREMSAGEHEITIFKIPHDYVFWDGTYLFGRGYFYETWHDIEFKETSFDYWYLDHWLK